ncbi:MAG: TipAS antibiotic-recognition domain-containing protein [Clostridia bacterium]|nr:TipAS antibiotic-recognition domain-containing protein [Clostridia bacterium]
MNNYSNEAKERWGNTDAYVEYTEKTKNYTKEKWDEANNGLLSVFAEFSTLKNNGITPDSAESIALLKKLQSHITENYYTCTDEILFGLGKMYVSDERFKQNIDKFGVGTAEFVSNAIDNYVKD